MRFHPLLKKGLALTLLFSVLNTCFAPSISFALTSGPENPDATSFEPVDSTDMVNLLTGDLAYTIPLLEVPGPEGGYPLALSYHAGIMPDEEASWTGLGWSLNPGAITRSVNGFPDDFDGQQNTVRDYWYGGNSSTTSVGVNIGLTGLLTADLGVVVSHDTFQGTGIGYYGGLTAGISLIDLDGQGTGLGASGSIGFSVDPFGNTSLTGGLGLNYGLAKRGNSSLSTGINLGFSANSQGVNAGAGAQISASFSSPGSNRGVNLSLLDASLGSGGSAGSISVGGGSSSVANVNFGKIQTSSRGWGITIPVFYGVSLSLKHNYTRYWSDESSAVSTFGTLHYPDIRENINYAGANYDTYYLPDITDQNYSLLNASKNDPAKSTGGTFPDYDTYSVLGQGISGYIRPYGYQMEVVGKGKYIMDYTTNRQQQVSQEEIHCDFDWTTGQDVNCQPVTTTTTYTKNPSKLNFRFTNDFSNRYVQENTPLTSSSSMNFDTNPIYGNNDGTYGFDPAAERLAGSRNIEYYTNDAIKSGSAKTQGFINTKAQGFNRAQNPDGSAITTGDSRIGGFVVTNESGVNYHYALPTYSYEEYSKTSNIYGVQNYNEQRRDKPYATAWLLTAVTGPDYVDINENGYADQGDWGYWVSFEYGKWTGSYAWRNPGVGSKSDLDQNFSFHSRGKKELYYLDAVVTPTHTAIFEKEIRADGKGMVNDDNANPYDGLATAQLRLNNIILLKNSSLENGVTGVRQASAIYNINRLHNGSNVIDKFDLQQNGLQTATIRKINFNYDYSLCPGTPNSFDELGIMYNNLNGNTAALPRLGKLTLNNLTFLGKGGAASIPATHFDYEIPADLVKQHQNVVFLNKKSNSDIYNFRINNVFTNASYEGNFAEGDIIKFSFSGLVYYGLIKQVSDQPADLGTLRRDMEVKFLKEQPNLTPNTTHAWSSTKNPPYLSESYDMWGLLKADYQRYAGNENLSRLPSKSSAKSVDAWSLRRVQHPLGMTTDIIYESDVYSNVALYRNAAIQVSAIDAITAPVFKVTSNNLFGIDLRDFIRPGDKVQLSLSGDYHSSEIDPQYGGMVDVSNGVSVSSGTDPSLLVSEVHENYLLINDPAFYQILFQNPNGTVFYGGNMSAGGLGNNYGGGIRIKQVVNNEPITGVSMAVNYNYNKPDAQALSSGTTSYEPIGIDAVSLRSGGNTAAYQDNISKSFSKLLGLVRDLPAPGVMYEYVTVSSQRTVSGQTVDQLGKSQYQFEVFKEGMVGHFPTMVKSGNTEIATVLLQNYTSRIGQLKRAIQYDNIGNKLSETINHYLHDEQIGESAKTNATQYENLLARYNKQGLITERTAEARNNDGKTRYVMSMRSTFPTVMTGTTTIDYKTGIRSKSETVAYDFYSGSATKVLTNDGYGNQFVSQSTPAYRIYPEMGLKLHNVKNANMLSQVAENTLSMINSANVPGIISSTATVWSNQLNMLNNNEQIINTNAISANQPNIWRKAKTYQWAPNDRTGGVTSLSEYISFFGTGGATLPAWLNTAEITLYNKYSNPLEVKDVMGNYGATKMGYGQSKVVATASPSSYAEMNFSGFEEDESISAGVLTRGIALGSASITTNASHTGDRSAVLGTGQSGLSYSVNINKLKSGRNYTASVWLKTAGSPTSSGLYFKVNGGATNTAVASISKKAGNWYLVNLQIPASALASGGVLEVGCININSGSTFFDDFRFKPVNASMTSYVYDAMSGELTYTLDNSNIFTNYQYDSEGRLVKTARETFAFGVKDVEEYVYNYAKSAAAKWQLTGNTRCQQINGVNTGKRESEQVDVNTTSISYNQTRWIVSGSSSQCIVP